MKNRDGSESRSAGAGSAASQGSPGRKTGGLEELVETVARIDGAHDPVDLEAVLLQIGRRSFGAILLFAGIIVLVPLIGDIPGVPTLAGLLVALASVQLLAGRSFFWLPEFLLRRAISRQRLERVLHVMQRPARFTDRLLRQRMELFISPVATRVIAIFSLAVALVMPLMEFIPFSANVAGIALSAFGISLVARDGLFALISVLVSIVAFGLVGYWLTNQ